jgi:4-hydroxybenzoate polyprenyltransferase
MHRIPPAMSAERLLTIILAIAFLAAPPIALLYGPGPGLFVLAGALLATIALAWSVRAHVPDHAQQRMQAMLVLNGVLLVAAVVGLVLVAL